jgi:multimeric flavodoxin WrbA
MKIVILDGALENTPKTWNKYLRDLTKVLDKKGHEVNHFILYDHDIHHCVGCFKCWVQTPGMCVFDDDSREINRAIINSDFVLFASPLVMGFPASVLKKKMDRMIPLVHPYSEIVQGETHHIHRYEKYPLFGLLLQPECTDTEENISIVNQIFARTALNIKSRLAFAVTTEETAQKTAARIDTLENEYYEFSREFPKLDTEKVGKLRKLTVFNGSPRGKRGNTPALLKHLMDGFTSIGGNTAEIYHLQQIKKKAEFASQFQNAECVLIGFPLYTDGMPGIVKEFIEALQPFTQRESNPPIAFMVQSGFSEALHSRYVEQYLMTLADRLNSPYLGTLVRGGCEGVRLQPEKMNRKIFAALHALGRQLGEQGGLERESVKAFCSFERISAVLVPLVKLVGKLPFMSMYWDMQLKKNNAFKDRFARPYEETAAGK